MSIRPVGSLILGCPEGLPMRLLTLGLTMGIFLLAPAYVCADISYSSYAFGKRYEVTFTFEALDKTPKWGEDDENPPLSARKALKAANKMKDSLVKDAKGFKWRLVSLDLTPADGERWYWIAHYKALTQKGTGRPPSLKLVVLMDGRAVKPVISDHR